MSVFLILSTIITGFLILYLIFKFTKKTFQTQSKTSQSPINLQTTSKLLSKSELKTKPFSISYPFQLSNCQLINTGHTIQINISSKNQSKILINNKQFTLKQFHFHSPSEHTIDHQSYDLEMHLVHINEKTNEIAVLGFIFDSNIQPTFHSNFNLNDSRSQLIKSTDKEFNKNTNNIEPILVKNNENSGSEEEEEEEGIERSSSFSDIENENEIKNEFLEQFINDLIYKKDLNGIILKNNITFDNLFEMSGKNIKNDYKNNKMIVDMNVWEYNGSLTTKPFTEGVYWFVNTKINFISKIQLKKLQKCWNYQNNARNIQMLCGRCVKIRCGVCLHNI